MRVSYSTIVRSVGDRAEALRLRLLATFRLEAADHLATIRSGLEALAADMRGPNAPVHLESLFRAMHTLKGAARSVGIIDFESTCHRCETLLSNLIQTGAAVEPSVMRALEDTADLLAGFSEFFKMCAGSESAQTNLGNPRITASPVKRDSIRMANSSTRGPANAKGFILQDIKQALDSRAKKGSSLFSVE